MAFVGLVGGLVIEAWGTQTRLWTYYTLERPPLWIIPAWPVARLAIDRIFRLLLRWTNALYALVFGGFYVYMVAFVWPTRERSLTQMPLFLLRLPDPHPAPGHCPARHAADLRRRLRAGYFLERRGTTRLCWTYYTLHAPPFFAVLAHGMAAVAFWRVVEVCGCLPKR